MHGQWGYLRRYFDLLEGNLISNGLMDEPCCLYNADETSLCLDANPIKVIGPKGRKHFYSVTSGKKTQVTVLSAVNAAGQYVPPLIISNRKNLPSMSSVEVPGSVYAYSRSGWIDEDLFEDWFIDHFLHYVPPKRPLLLDIQAILAQDLLILQHKKRFLCFAFSQTQLIGHSPSTGGHLAL